MPVKVAIIIVNFHSSELVCRCLQSLVRYMVGDITYLVVDNSSNDDGTAIKEKFPQVTVFKTSKNLGFGGGCNLAMRYALDQDIDYVQLLNPDTRVEHNFLGPLLGAMHENPRIGVVSPKIFRDGQEEGVWYAGSKINWWLGGPQHISSAGREDGRSVVQVPSVSGCAMLIRTEAIKEVGFFDDGYFLYFEDSDYVQRFFAAGWQVAYVPEGQVYHQVSSVVDRESCEYVYYFARNRIWFMRRWSAWYHYMVFMTYNILVKMPGAAIVFGLMQKKPALTLAYWRGTIDGIRQKMKNEEY